MPADPALLLAAGAVADGQTDNSAAFDRVIAELARRGGGTLAVPDGVFGLGRTLALPRVVSLELTPGATLRALPGFQGQAVVLKGSEGNRGAALSYGVIRGGTIDGGAQDLVGIQVNHACRLEIQDLEVRNACRKGISVGTTGWYECNVSRVRCYLEHHVRSSPGSIGVHYEKCGDSFVSAVVIIGYETGLRSDTWSNDIHQVHVWNHQGNGPLKYCFYCGGWNDSYNQCYADSPMNGDAPGYGFYVARPHNRIIAGRVYCNDYATADRVVGVHATDQGTHGTYVGLHFTAREGHAMRLAFGGNLEGATILGCTYSNTVNGGKV